MFDDTELKSLLALSKLSIPEKQYARLSKQLEDILHYFERLSLYDTSHVDVDLGAAVEIDSRRVDEARAGFDSDAILSFSNALDENGFFDVPRILRDDNG